MKIAILNDTHLGVRNSSDIFLDNAAQFYTKTFFPYLLSNGIKQILHLGDYYDNRKAINIKALNHNRKYFLVITIPSLVRTISITWALNWNSIGMIVMTKNTFMF